tara:strand:- start:1377 stop:2159 length:783 start_codon:yes stop_codon:yes gene_type:complete
MKILRNIRGNSGCSLSLIKDPELDVIVRKQSPNIKYNPRLHSQHEKQKNFYSNCLLTPQIYRSGFLDGLYYFDMEYIIGTKFSDYIHQNSIQNTFNHVSIILDFIKSNNTIDYIKNSRLVEDKIKNTLDKIKDSSISLTNFKPLNDFSLSYCHGDLTFENIIVNSRGELYLIDFLDSFINTRLIDYSKLLQDLLFMWSWRNDCNKPYTKLVLLQEFLEKNISVSDYKHSYHLMKVNLLRILPYVKQDSLLYNTIRNFILK